MTALESKVLELLNHRVTLKMAQTVIECVKKECVEAVERGTIYFVHGVYDFTVPTALVMEIEEVRRNIKEVK